MNRRATREGDLDNKRNVNVVGSPNVVTNNRRAVREGDIDSKKNVLVTGSSTVFINGRRAGREGDIDNKRNTIVVGSNNVLMGDMSFDIPSPPANQVILTPSEAKAVLYAVSNSVRAANAPVTDLVTHLPLTLAPVTSYHYSVIDSDDEGAPSDYNGTVIHTAKQRAVSASAQVEAIDIATPPNVIDTATISNTAPVLNSSYSYADIDAATSFPPTFQLSPRIKLGDVTTGCRVSKYALKAQFTGGKEYYEHMIVRNLRDLCYNIIEPLMTRYPGLVINSGFRHGSGSSQHERGQAVDICFSGMDTDINLSYNRAKDIVNSDIPYDQFIYEQNNTIWFHLSFDKSKPTQRKMVMSKPRGVNSPYQGLTKVA